MSLQCFVKEKYFMYRYDLGEKLHFYNTDNGVSKHLTTRI